MILGSQGVPFEVLFIFGIAAFMIFMFVTVPKLTVYRFGVLLISLVLGSLGLFAYAIYEYTYYRNESASTFSGLLAIAASIVLFAAVHLINGLKKKEKVVKEDLES